MLKASKTAASIQRRSRWAVSKSIGRIIYKTSLPIASEFLSGHVRSLMKDEVKYFDIGIKIDYYRCLPFRSLDNAGIRANRILTIS
jgi:hypothetical protein